MLDLFPNEKINLNLPDAVFEWYPNFLTKEIADELFQKLLHELHGNMMKSQFLERKYSNQD